MMAVPRNWTLWWTVRATELNSGRLLSTLVVSGTILMAVMIHLVTLLEVVPLVGARQAEEAVGVAWLALVVEALQPRMDGQLCFMNPISWMRHWRHVAVPSLSAVWPTVLLTQLSTRRTQDQSIDLGMEALRVIEALSKRIGLLLVSIALREEASAVMGKRKMCEQQ
jgi:hypothetical protein